MNENNGIYSILSGDKPIQISIGIDPLSISYLIGGGFMIGILLILFAKKVVK